MPRIPIYGEQQVRTSGLPDTPDGFRISQQDALAFAGAQDSVAMAKTASALEATALHVQDTNDKAAVVEQSGVLSLAVATHHANLDKMTGADASKIVAANEEFWKKFEGESTSKMTPRQQSMFGPVIARMKAGSFESAIKAQTKGADDYLNLTLLGTQSSAAAAARENPTNDEVLRAQAGIYKGALAAQIDRMKLKGPAKDMYVRDQMAKFHEPIIYKLMETDSHAAIGYYNTNIKEISLDKRKDIEKALKTGGMAQYAQEAVDETVAKMGYTPEALEHIRKTYSGDHEEAVIREFTARQSETERVTNDFRKNTVESLFQKYTKSGPGSLNSLKRTKEYMDLDDEGKNNFDAMADQHSDEQRAEYRSNVHWNESRVDRAKSKAREAKTETHDGNYAKYDELSATDPKAFAAIDFNGKTAELSGTQITALKKRQTESAPGGREAKDTWVRRMSTDMARTAGVTDKGLWGLHTAVSDAIMLETESTGKPVDQARAKQIINSHLAKGYTENWLGFKSETRVYKNKPGMILDIPAADRKEIEDNLRKRGMAVTPQAVADYYYRANGK